MNQVASENETLRGDGAGELALEVSGLTAAYGKHRVLSDINLTLHKGELLGLLGHNGAGKTSLLKSILGLIKPTEGTITYQGTDITGRRPSAMVSSGISMVPQGDIVFPSMTIDEHLRLCGQGSAAAQRERVDLAFDLFPILKERRNKPAGLMSGGQRQMLAISCSLVQLPQVLLLDEPSTGLAPLLVEQVFDAIKQINSELNTSIIVVEQDAPRLMHYVSRFQVIKLGETVFQGTAAELQAQEWVDLF